jgi:tetratricopeptide (TPR) repeat protein
MEAAALRQSLWDGPLADPLQPARDLARRVLGGADYAPVLDEVRLLATHGLPLSVALAPAMGRWAWSIDLARLAVDAGLPGGLDSLRARVLQQRRRFGVLARALWDAGQPGAALDVLAEADPGGQTRATDLETRVELALAWPDPARAQAALAEALPLLPPGRAGRLRLLALWQSQGATALAQAADAGLPDDPAPWAFLWQAWLTERDLPRAAAALDRLAALRHPDDPETPLDRIRVALEREDPETAEALLAALPPLPTADWSQRRHALHLRARIALGDLRGDAGLWRQACEHATRALRVYPQNGLLVGLALVARERTGDWDDLAADLNRTPASPVTMAGLARLGLPEPVRLGDPAPPPWTKGPDAQADRQRLQADLYLQSGDLAAALAATDGPPLPSPAAAARAEWRIEALLWQREGRAALTLLDTTLASHPARLGLILQRARARFLLGDFTGAEGALEDFRTRKLAQTGLPPAEDLRDRITADALSSGQALPEGEGAAASARRLGPALAAHPGLAACWLARPGAVPAFRPDPSADIPTRLTLYWEGPTPDPVARGIRAWRTALPGWQAQIHDATSARDWLSRHDPQGGAAFDALTTPAARADLFRACLIAQAGGLYVDSDEYPRGDVRPWITGARAVVVLESGYGTVANNFLAAVPGLPLFLDLRERVLARLARTPAPYPWWDTGPAQLTGALAGWLSREPAPAGLRVLSQADYCARVTTNLPFPHKRGPGHWRQGLSRPPVRQGAA